MELGEQMFIRVVKLIKQYYPFNILIFLGIAGLYFLVKNTSQKNDQSISRRLLKENGYFVPLEIQGFSTADIPYLKLIIENKIVPTEIDLGYGGMISLSSDIIKELNNKKFVKRVRTYGFRGRTYENDLYEVEKIDTK